MIRIIILSITSLLFLMAVTTIINALFKKRQFVGRPTIPSVFFAMAKIFPFINLVFLFLKGLNIQISVVYRLPFIVDYIALVFLISGFILANLTSIRLKDDLIFGLSDSEKHKLQTKGIYSISRHPLYLGFLFILISSVLFVPNIFNIVTFVFAWILHHIIMIKEEEHLISRYGEEYKQYMKKIKRYLIV